VLAMRGDAGFPVQVIASSIDHMLPFHDLAVDASGKPHVFHSSDPPDGQAHLQLDAGGAWQAEPIGHPGQDWERFSTTPGGAAVSLGYEQTSQESWQLLATLGATTRSLGSEQTGAFPGRYRPFAPARTGGGPEYGAAISSREALRVAWASTGPDGLQETTLPGSAEPDLECKEGFTARAPPCPATCVERKSGLFYQAFAVATSASHAYLAYSLSHLDRDVRYELQNIDGMDRCVGQAGEDRSTSELVLLRVAFAGGAMEPLLSLPMANLGRQVMGDAEQSDAGPVAISVDAGMLAVSVRTDRDGKAQVRVLHVAISM
jgi:hypothetical protein